LIPLIALETAKTDALSTLSLLMEEFID